MFVVDYATIPLNVDIQRVDCRNSIVVHSTLNVRQSIHFGLSIRHTYTLIRVEYNTVYYLYTISSTVLLGVNGLQYKC